MPPWYGKDIYAEAIGKVEDFLDADGAAPVLNLPNQAWAAAHEGSNLLLRVSELFAPRSNQPAKVTCLKD